MPNLSLTNKAPLLQSATSEMEKQNSPESAPKFASALLSIKQGTPQDWKYQQLSGGRKKIQPPLTSKSSAAHAPHFAVTKPEADIIVYSTLVIQNLNKLPGITSDATVDEVEIHRAALQNCLSQLKSNGRLTSEGPDISIRPIVVGVQAIIENTLLCLLEEDLITEVNIIFTTNKPPTPLSTAESALPDSLATPAVLNSPECLDTIASRQHLLHKLIARPEVSMFSYYVQKHNESEQGYFDRFCEKNAPQFNAQLVSDIPERLLGATYKIMTNDKQEQWFGIRFTQANMASKQCILFSNIELEGEKSLLFNWITKNSQV